jgi:hypothetical protein
MQVRAVDAAGDDLQGYRARRLERPAGAEGGRDGGGAPGVEFAVILILVRSGIGDLADGRV